MLTSEFQYVYAETVRNIGMPHLPTYKGTFVYIIENVFSYPVKQFEANH